MAENNRIAQVLADGRDWPSDRVSEIWSCGRANETLPEPTTREETRRRLQTEFGLNEKNLLFLSTAKMRLQKRPLDFVALADRARNLDHVHYLIVGRGDLEDQVCAEIDKTKGTSIRRLPFRSDISEFILAVDVRVTVSDFEGLPVFLLECLQLRRLFLGTRVGDLGTGLDEIGACIVVEQPGILDKPKEAVRRLADTGLRSKLYEDAALAGARFDVESCAKVYAAVFKGGR